MALTMEELWEFNWRSGWMKDPQALYDTLVQKDNRINTEDAPKFKEFWDRMLRDGVELGGQPELMDGFKND